MESIRQRILGSSAHAMSKAKSIEKYLKKKRIIDVIEKKKRIIDVVYPIRPIHILIPVNQFVIMNIDCENGKGVSLHSKEPSIGINVQTFICAHTHLIHCNWCSK